MKKFILLGLVILFVTGCNVNIIRNDKIQGTGSMYQVSSFIYSIEKIKKEFPNAVLITSKGSTYYLYIKEE
jgi:hypothetical protein